MSELLSIGISHKTAPVALRERLSLPTSKAKQLMADLLDCEEIHEAVALSTCNRTELYAVTSDAVAAESDALGRLATLANIRPTELVEQLYTHRGSDAAAHLMRVASGLDSMVVGESEILGQIKRAYELALSERMTGTVTNRLFTSAIAAGKRVQSETAIGEGRVSVASTSVELAGEVLGDLAGREALVIGSGANGELTARSLADAGVPSVFVANRHYARAIGVAERVGGRAVRLEHLPEELIAVDIVLGSTGSPHTLIQADEMRLVMEARGGRPLLMVDIAVPRDFDPAVGQIPGVTLLDMDDLQATVEQNLNVRRSEAAKAENLIAQEIERFENWLNTLDAVPTIAELRNRGLAIAEQVVDENVDRFSNLNEEDRARLGSMAASIVARLLHEPTLNLKSAAESGDTYEYLKVLRELFALEDGVDADDATDGKIDAGADVHSLDARRRRDRA